MHIVWDEDNLKQNEEIQKEYSVVRISEPKTPYRPPLPSDSLEDEMKPLQLDEGELHADKPWCCCVAAAGWCPSHLLSTIHQSATFSAIRCLYTVYRKCSHDNLMISCLH